MSAPRVFCCDYTFLSCGSVFTDGLVHAAEDLGVDYAHAGWDAPNLLQRIETFNPDLVFVVHGRRYCQTHRDKMNRVSALWLLDEPYECDNTAAFSSRFDHVFLNDPATLDRHPRSAYLPTCYDPHVHYADETPRTKAVGFIGGGNATRHRYLMALAQANLLTYVVGGPWYVPAIDQRCLSLNISPAHTAALYRETRIVVNIFREKHHYNRQQIPATSLNPRIYEALACGAIVVSEWRPEVQTLVPELPTFRTESECVSLVRHLLDDPQEAEAIRSQCAARLAPHTYAARLQTVLATVPQEAAA